MSEKLYSSVKYFIGRCSVLFMLVLFPVILKNKLSDITRTRYEAFIFAAFVLFLLMCLNEAVYMVSARKFLYKLSDVPSWLKIVLVWGFFCVVSYFVSPYKRYALAGAGSRYVGLVFMLACICLYITVSHCYIFSRYDIIAALCISVPIHLLAVLNFVGIDPFHFFDYLPVSQSTTYISVFGNINVYGVYAVLTAAISVTLYVTGKGRRGSVVYIIFSLFSISGVIVADSDTACIGFLVAMLLIFFLALRKFESLRNYLFIVLLTLVAGRIAGCGRFLNLTYGRIVESAFSPLLYSNWVFAAIVVMIAMIILLDRYSEKVKYILNEHILEKLNYVYEAILGAVIFVLVCLLIYYNFICKDVPQWADNVFVINESWGSYRGHIWKNLMDGYKNMPFIYKLFGTGEATISCVLSDYSSIHWNLLNGGLTDNAHNILLQLLITTGLAGLVSYLAVIVHFLRMVLYVYKKRKGRMCTIYYMALGIAGIASFVQGFFCLFETITFPIFICIIAIMNTYGRRKLDS